MKLSNAIHLTRGSALTKLLTVLAALTLAGCTSALDHPAEQRWTVSKPLDDTVACLVGALSAGNKHVIDGQSAIPFAAGIIEPGRVYDIRPTRQITLGMDSVTVRVIKVTDRQTNVELYAAHGIGGSHGDWMVKPHIGKCVT